MVRIWEKLTHHLRNFIALYIISATPIGGNKLHDHVCINHLHIYVIGTAQQGTQLGTIASNG